MEYWHWRSWTNSRVTTRKSQWRDDLKISRNYGTKDRVLQYKIIHEYFFMDILFATKKAGKVSHGHTCCHIFVTKKEFLYVITINYKSKRLQDVNEFVKGVGAPDAILRDDASEQKSKSLQRFLGKIGTMLRVIEEVNPMGKQVWAIHWIDKRGSENVMKEYKCTLNFWYYCVERQSQINNLTAKYMFKLYGSNSHTANTGGGGGIYNICKYGWYEFFDTDRKPLCQ